MSEQEIGRSWTVGHLDEAVNVEDPLNSISIIELISSQSSSTIQPNNINLNHQQSGQEQLLEPTILRNQLSWQKDDQDIGKDQRQKQEDMILPLSQRKLSSHSALRQPTHYFAQQIHRIIAKQRPLIFENQPISQQILSYSTITNILLKALSIFKSEIKNKLLSIVNFSLTDHWNNLIQEHFEKQYIKDADDNCISRIIRVYYDLMRAQDFISQIQGHHGSLQQVIEQWVSLAEKVNKQVLEKCLSELQDRTKAGVQTIQHLYINASSRYYKAKQYVLSNLKHTYLQRNNHFKLVSFQLIKSIKDGVKRAAKEILQTLGLPNGLTLSQQQKDTLLKLEEISASISAQSAKITPFYHLLIQYCALAFRDTLQNIQQKIINCVQRKISQQTDQDLLYLALDCMRKRMDGLNPDLSHYFKLPIPEQVYSREYLQWFRGRHEQEKNLLYKKHYNMINYLALTKPESVITYYRTFQTEPNKRFDFFMERGDTNFINFQGGYSYFKKLDLKEKIRYIMDIAEALIELHYHGITHNDVTLRNTVKVRDHYKIIDFDVARMVKKNIDLRLYSQEETQLIQHYRDQCVKCSSRLLKKELKEEQIIQQTIPKKAVTPVQNINRLSEYFALKAENQMIMTIEKIEKEEEEKKLILSREQKLKLTLSYQNIVTGKRDCSTFGLMLLKLMHKSSGGFNLGTMDLMIKLFMGVLYSDKTDDADYMEMTQNFSLDKGVSADTQRSLLKLIARLMTPNLSKRIPMKLFALEFLSIMNISHYGLKIDADSTVNRDIAYDTFIKHYNNKVNTTSEATKILQFSLQPSTISKYNIKPIFITIKQTLEQAKDHQMRVYQLLYKIKIDKQRPFDFEVEMVRAQQLNAVNSLMQLILQYRKKLQKQVLQALKGLEYKYLCLQHMKEALAYCQEYKCQKRWLCLDCLHQCYKLPSEQRRLAHITFGQFYQTIQHKIIHIHSKKEIIFAAKIYGSYIYGCQDCIDDFWKYPTQRQFHMIDTSKRIMMDRMCLQVSQRQNPYLIGRRQHIHKNTIGVDFYELVTSATARIEHLKKQGENQVVERLQTSKSKIATMKEQFGRQFDELMDGFRRDPEYEHLIKLSKFVKQMPRILQIIDGKSSQLEQYRQLLIEISQKANIYSVFQNWQLQAEKHTVMVEQLLEDVRNVVANGRQRRQKWKITNPNIDNMLGIISQVPIKIQLQASRMPSLPAQISKTNKKKQKLSFENSNQSSVEHKDQQSQPMSKIQMADEISHRNNIVDFELCKKCISKSRNNISSKKIQYICLEKDCPSPLLCESCRPYDPHFIKIHLPSFAYTLEDEQQEEIFYFQKIEQRLSSKLMKESDNLVKDLKSQLATHINFIEQVLCFNSSEEYKISQKIYNELKSALKESNFLLFSELVYILNRLNDDIPGFLRVVINAVNKYSSCLTQTIIDLKKLSTKYFEGRNKLQVDMSSLLATKYKKIVKDGDSHKPKIFYQIPQRYHQFVEEVEINGININQNYQKEQLELQLLQLRQKIVRNGFNMFELHLALEKYHHQPTFALERISKFHKLQKLVVIDTPHIHALNFETQLKKSSPLFGITYFDSLAIQQILSQAPELKQMTIKCFNGFDRYCWNQIKAKPQRKIILEIYSYRELSLQYNCLQRLFQSSANCCQYFRICGQAIGQLDLEACKDLVTGQIRLNLTPFYWQSTLEQLHILQQSKYQISAHYLELYVNSFSPLEETITFNQLYNNFLLESEKDEQKQQINAIELSIQRQTGRLASLLTEIEFKNIFVKVKHLSLYGIVLGCMRTKKKQYLQINQKIRSAVNWDVLCHLQMKKCLGLPIDLISGPNLETLAIEDSLFFIGAHNDIYPTFLNLKFLSLINVRTKGACKYQNLASYLQEFKLNNIKTLIINDSFSLVTEQLLWLSCTQIEYLSLRRCHLVTNEILSVLKEIPTLKYIDLTSTLIKPYDLQYLATHPAKQCMKNHTKQKEISSAWSMEEINRIAIKYNVRNILQGYKHQSLPYENLLHFKSIKFIDQLFEQKKTFDFLRPLEELPEVQVIYFDNCRWISYHNFKRLIIEPMHTFPFLKNFEKLKELTIKNCQLKEFDQNLCNYQFLRRLNLSMNQLTSISGMKYDNLIELDVSYNKLKQIEFAHKAFPCMVVLNLYHNQIQSLGTHLKDFRSLRILYFDHGFIGGIPLDYKKYILYHQVFTQKQLAGEQRYQNICYIVTSHQVLRPFWHLQLLLYNIEMDITQGITPFREESKAVYLQNQHIICKRKPSNLYNPQAICDNPQFHSKIISSLYKKDRYFYNEANLKIHFKALKQQDYEPFDEIQKNTYLVAKYLSENKTISTMFQYELQKQFMNKEEYSFVVLGEKGKRQQSFQNWESGVWKVFNFIQTAHQTFRDLKEHNILHLRLQLSNFIQVGQSTGNFKFACIESMIFLGEGHPLLSQTKRIIRSAVNNQSLSTIEYLLTDFRAKFPLNQNLTVKISQLSQKIDSCFEEIREELKRVRRVTDISKNAQQMFDLVQKIVQKILYELRRCLQHRYKLFELQLVASALFIYPECVKDPHFKEKINLIWKENTGQHDLLQ